MSSSRSRTWAGLRSGLGLGLGLGIGLGSGSGSGLGVGVGLGLGLAAVAVHADDHHGVATAVGTLPVVVAVRPGERGEVRGER